MIYFAIPYLSQSIVILTNTICVLSPKRLMHSFFFGFINFQFRGHPAEHGTQ